MPAARSTTSWVHLSPVLWRKLPGARSAGRVQSVALRLVCDREAEIEAFRTEEYWTIEATMETGKREEFAARLSAIDGQRVDKLDIKDEATSSAIKAAIEKGEFKVVSVDKKAVKRNPYAPFATSTMQMDASRKLGFSAKQTMQVAQRLYEGVDIGGRDGRPHHLHANRRRHDHPGGHQRHPRPHRARVFAEVCLPLRARVQGEGQERPGSARSRAPHRHLAPPQDVAQYLERDQARLYELIWKRTVASQMASAEVEQTSADIEVKGRDGKVYTLRATGSVVQFEGFLRVYEEGRDDRVRVVEKGKEDHSEDEDTNRLPPLAQGDRVTDKAISPEQHFTQPPPRYSEATLVKRMEELGIGRPSTYASTLAVLQERDYVRTEKKRLIPEDKGRLVIAFLESFFKRYVEFDFTADLEEKLDLISDGKLEWKEVLREFWRDFMAAVGEIKDLRVSEVLDALNDMLGPHIFPVKAEGGDPRSAPTAARASSAQDLGQVRRLHRLLALPRLPLHAPTLGIRRWPGRSLPRWQASRPRPRDRLASHVAHGPVRPLRAARRGQQGREAQALLRAAQYGCQHARLERALQLLSLPRQVGMHPETNTPIVANLGRFGPFILHDGTYVNLPAAEEIFTIGLNHAVVLLAEKRAGGGKGRFQRAAPTVLKELGEHPAEGGKVQVLSGRYGPYVKHGDVNATLPKSKDPAQLTMDEAVALIAERAAKGPSKPKRGAKAKPKAKADAAEGEEKPKKAAAKKSAPKSKKATKTPLSFGRLLLVTIACLALAGIHPSALFFATSDHQKTGSSRGPRTGRGRGPARAALAIPTLLSPA